jgi:NitT/TauT family transport system substrate-binding protein
MKLRMGLAFKSIALSVLITSSLLSFSQSGVARADSNNCGNGQSSSSEIGKLIIGASIQQIPTIEWGIRQGCFAKFGLNVKTVPVAAFPLGVAGLVSKSFDLYATTPINVLKTVTDGSFSPKIISPKYGYTAEELAVARSNPKFEGQLLMATVVLVNRDSTIKTWKDLDKKKIGVLSFQGIDHAGVLTAMKEVGVRNPKSEFITISNSMMADALKRGDVDAVVAIDPFASQIIKDGGRIIGYPVAYVQEAGPAFVYMSSSEIVKNKSREMRAFKKANLEVNRLLNKPENEASWRKIISEVTRVSEDVANRTHLEKMSEKDLTIAQLAYLPSKLKKVGFIKGRFELSPILFQ